MSFITGRRQELSLLITNDYPPIVSGIGTVFYNLFKLQDKKEYFILCPWEKGSEDFDKKDDMPVIRVKVPTGESKVSKVLKTVINLLVIFKYVFKLKVGRIHCGQIISNGIAGLLCKKLLNIPYVVWVYGSETIRFGDSKLLASIMRRVLSSAEIVVAISDFTKEEYLQFGVDREKLMIITPGVDTSLFTTKDKSDRLLQKYNLYNKKVLLTVARLDERKGHDMVIRAMSSLKGQFPDIVYLIVGRGREEQRIRNLVREEGLEDLVVFAGYVSDEELPDYYNLCDIFILPNRETKLTALKGDYEGFGIVFLEANACGKPVIGGRSGGVRDAVEEGVTGVLVDPDSIDEIVSAIKNFLINKEEMYRMGIAGRQRVEKQFDWNILARSLERIL
ncbi:MAG: glycosyltransferase family 4 protein [Deltaproteobacteria bacterium]|nr:glycosyltransferase family 4 protein [Deltaproteobacteria bacterium]